MATGNEDRAADRCRARLSPCHLVTLSPCHLPEDAVTPPPIRYPLPTLIAVIALMVLARWGAGGRADALSDRQRPADRLGRRRRRAPLGHAVGDPGPGGPIVADRLSRGLGRGVDRGRDRAPTRGRVDGGGGPGGRVGPRSSL